MSAPAERLSWDSAFFGFEIGRVTSSYLDDAHAERVARWAAQGGVKCVYFLCDPSDLESVWTAERHDFRLVDVRLVLGRSVDPSEPLARTVCVRPFTDPDIDALRAIARGSIRATRFQNDPGFPAPRARELYEIWIERSCRGYAEHVLVADVDGEPGGFLTCHIESGRGRIGLLAVAERMQRLGIGRQLIAAGLAYFRSCAVSDVEVATQLRNVSAQRLYQQCGFVSRVAHLWFHRWFA